jgi:DNA polymerase III epsilon subunit-like protein
MNLPVRREAVELARLWLARQPLFIDTETTGTGPNAEVIEIAVVNTEGAVVYESLVKPRGKIEDAAMRVHGITADSLQDAPSWDGVWPMVESVLGQNIIGAYNSDFDVRLLKQTHQRYWMTWQIPDEQFFCVMKLYARFVGEWNRQRGSYRWHSLEEAGKQCQIRLANTHHAKDDALLARAVFLYMANWQG